MSNFVKFITFFILIILTILVCNAAAKYTDGHNGRPLCATEQELIQKSWRNNFDPTRYWVCSQKSVAAVSVSCESGDLFSPDQNKCVHHSEWTWTAPADPPSLAWE